MLNLRIIFNLLFFLDTQDRTVPSAISIQMHYIETLTLRNSDGTNAQAIHAMNISIKQEIQSKGYLLSHPCHPFQIHVQDTLTYMYNIVEKVNGSENTCRDPPTNSQIMRYNINMHVKAFLIKNKDNPKGLYYSTSQEQIITCKTYCT